MRQRRHRERNAAGYVVSIELVLILTILLIGMLAGCVMVRDEVLEFFLHRSRQDPPVVLDIDNALVGKTIGYDRCEAPQVVFRDPLDSDNLRAILLAVRPTRFVTRDRVFFSGMGCTSTPYLAPPAVLPIPPEAQPTGYLNALENLSYGIGPPRGWGSTCVSLPCTDGGLLYRSIGTAGDELPVAIQSVWTSLAPDCAILSEDAQSAPIVAIWGFDANSGAATFVDGAQADPMTPVIAAAGFAQIGTTGGCNCSTALGCICDDRPTPSPPETGYPTNSYLEFAVTCDSGDLQPDNLRLNARKVSSDAQETGFVHLLASSDGFASLSTAAVNDPLGPLGQQLSDIYEFDLTNLPPAATWTFRLHPERTGGNQTRFDIRLDDVTLSGYCGGTVAAGVVTEICGNVAETLDLLPAQEVVNASGDNLTEAFSPLFWVPPWSPAPELESIPPVAEADGLGTLP